MEDQLNLLEGLNRKDEGISRVENNAIDFVSLMRRVAMDHSSVFGSVTSDELRIYANCHGIRPHHQNAWGAVFKGKAWRCIGRKKSEYPDNHAREIKVWQYAQLSD